MLINASRSRDILECIASLSSDEVATPPAVANQVLDLLPVEVWSNKDLKWLDPACKTGVFLREAARRLMEGLKDSIPDETERRKHIFTKMLHGYALTELTAQMSRRSLYYNKDASSKKLSVVPFKRKEGNIQFSGQDHPYTPNGKCNICGAGKEVFGAPGNRERHAYDFIHSEEEPVKFDVVVGNPPYQLNDGGGGGKGSSASPIYQLFVEQAFKMRPRYIAMIIPSRWFVGGKGLDGFRRRMLQSTNFRNLFDFPDAEDLFPGVDIGGGICYFLWDRDFNGPCSVVTSMHGNAGAPLSRKLGDHGEVFVRFNEALPILAKVQSKGYAGMDTLVSSRKPFGTEANTVEYRESPRVNDIELLTSLGVKYINRREITTNVEAIDRDKVFVGKAYGERGDFPYWIIAEPKVAAPGAVCSETYLMIGPLDNRRKAQGIAKFLTTKFARFLIALRKPTQNITKDAFQFVPVVDMEKNWTDEMLYAEFGINLEEQLFIASIVKEWKK
jgi:site-specific DNA-methyltransferase (adenine-specific)